MPVLQMIFMVQLGQSHILIQVSLKLLHLLLLLAEVLGHVVELAALELGNIQLLPGNLQHQLGGSVGFLDANATPEPLTNLPDQCPLKDVPLGTMEADALDVSESSLVELASGGMELWV